MKFKQYLYDGVFGHGILCLKDAKAAIMAEANEDEFLKTLKVGDLRRTELTLKVAEDAEMDGEDLPVFEVEKQPNEAERRETDYFYMREYVEALSGVCPERRLVMAAFEEDGISFVMVEFDSGAFQRKAYDQCQVVGQAIIRLKSLPKWARIVMKMSPVEVARSQQLRVADTYEIRNLAEAGKPMRIAYDEYRDGELVRSRELGKDDNGEYEIITEA